MSLVFLHLIATSMALGAIVATDLRMLSKLAQDRVRIPPPNEFVARIVTIALLLLYVTGGCMLWLGTRESADYFSPKLQGKLILVLLLTINAFVLHRITFPRLARGRSVGRWRFVDWLVIVIPVSMSNCLWMFCAFLGIARPWNSSMSMRDILEIAATLYVVALVGVGLVLAAAGRQRPKDAPDDLVAKLKRTLAALGSLGKDTDPQHDGHRARTTLPPTLGRGPRAANAANAASVTQVTARGSFPGGARRKRA